MEAPAKLPNWTEDELMVALDVYLQTWRDQGYGTNSKLIIELSDSLRSMVVFPPEIREEPRFRNRDGVALKMHNFSSINPDKPEGGMPHGSHLDQKIWEAWAHRPQELHEVVNSIRANASSDQAAHDTGEEEEYEAEEGRLLYRMHRRYERDGKLVAKKKRDALARTGRSHARFATSRRETTDGKPAPL